MPKKRNIFGEIVHLWFFWVHSKSFWGDTHLLEESRCVPKTKNGPFSGYYWPKPMEKNCSFSVQCNFQNCNCKKTVQLQFLIQLTVFSKTVLHPCFFTTFTHRSYFVILNFLFLPLIEYTFRSVLEQPICQFWGQKVTPERV